MRQNDFNNARIIDPLSIMYVFVSFYEAWMPVQMFVKSRFK